MDIIIKSFQQHFLFVQAQLGDQKDIKDIFLGLQKFSEKFMNAGIIIEL
jgi:hypothetical protein